MVERREDPTASTAMFRAFVQRGDADSGSNKTINPVVWVVTALVVVAAVVIGVALFS